MFQDTPLIWRYDSVNNTAEDFFIGFNDMSTLVGHFVSSPREREKRDRRDSTGDERKGTKVEQE